MAAAPTVAMSQGADYTGGAGSSSTPSTSSLFNSDETKFMNDSFSSAESFDPFTVGAPGFKVPNVLPANIGGMGSAPGTMTARQENEQEGVNNGQQSLASLNDAGLNMRGTSSTSRGGYGQDKAWQLQQLEALQADRYRYMISKQDPSRSQQQPQPPQQQQNMQRHSLAGPSVLPDTSMIGHSLYQDNASGWGPYNLAQVSQQQNNQMGQHYPSNFSMNQSMHPSQFGSGDLSALGARFPSSHQFPGNRPASFPYFTGGQQMQNPGSFTGVGGIDQEMNNAGDDENRSKKGNQKGRRQHEAPAQHQQIQQLHQSLEAESSYTFTPAPRPPMPLLDVEKVHQSKIIPAEMEEEYFSTSLKRFQPHLIELRKEQMCRKAQGLSANIRKDRKEAKQAAKGGPGEDEDSGANESTTTTAAGKKKPVPVLLTEAEKKANHIASEQKRRANIRKGYELLCSLVPSLSEGMEDGGGGGNGDDEGDDDEEDDGDDGDDDEDEDDEEGGGNKRRGKKRRAMGEGGTTTTTSNENKTGPRSEAIILMKAVDHIRSKIDEHFYLVKRKQEIQNELAKRFGADQSCFLE